MSCLKREQNTLHEDNSFEKGVLQYQFRCVSTHCTKACDILKHHEYHIRRNTMHCVGGNILMSTISGNMQNVSAYAREFVSNIFTGRLL